jgi:hypothetical protein
MRRRARVALLQLVVAGSTPAQQAPVTRLTTADAEFPEPFTRIESVRALRDGRVMVLDGLELSVQLADFARGSLQPVGRKGAGPGEYQRPTGLYHWHSDTTALVDMATRRVLLIRPDGKPGPSFDPRATPSGEAVAALLNAPQAFDGFGHMFTAAQPVRRARNRSDITLADSSAIERWTRGARTRDTVAWRELPEDPTRRVIPGVGVIWSPTRRAFMVDDQWTVTSDGRIAFVRWNPYRVDFVDADGLLHRGPLITYERVRVSEAHRKKFQADLERPQVVTAFREGYPTRTQVIKPPPDPTPWEFPDYLPPFLNRAIAAAPDGYLWVQRTTAADAQPIYDLVNRAGVVAERVEIPMGSRVVGFGVGAVYVVRVDVDDLEYLQRYRFTPRARP